MRERPKLIMLGGFAASGKSTIAERYISDHPLALCVEGDEIITKLGQWRSHIKEAVESKFSLTACMATTHLRVGYDVILPFLLGNESHAEMYENLATEAGADFFEFYIYDKKDEAIKRLLARGSWGETGLPPITQEDLPRIERLYEEMIEAVAKRPNMITIESTEGDIEGTYKALITGLP